METENDFDKVFNNAISTGRIGYKNKNEENATRSLYNILFNNWLRDKFNTELTQENYPSLCINKNFIDFLDQNDEEENKMLPRSTLSTIEKLDEVLKFITISPFAKAGIGVDQLFKRLNFDGIKIDDYDELYRMLDKLVRDELIDDKTYNKKYDGIMFYMQGGYIQKSINDDLNNKTARRNERLLRNYTLWLTVATWIASICLLIEVVLRWKDIYCMFHDCV